MSEPLTWTHAPTALYELRPRNKVRRWIERMMEAGGPTDEEVRILMLDARDYTMWRWRERAAVCWYLGNAPLSPALRPEVAEALAAVMVDTWNGSNERGARWLRRCAIAGAATSAMLLASLAGGDAGLSAIGGFLVFGALCSVLCLLPVYPISSAIERARLAWVRRQAALGLKAMAYPELLPAAVSAAGDRSGVVREPAWQAACAMLRETTVAYYGQLGEAVVPLCAYLRSAEPQTQVFLIDALARFADGRAVEPIERLLQRHDVPADVIEAAGRALPILRERQRLEREASRLLRPSQAPAADGSALLRPAAGAPVDEALLLRAAEEEPE